MAAIATGCGDKHFKVLQYAVLAAVEKDGSVIVVSGTNSLRHRYGKRSVYPPPKKLIVNSQASFRKIN